MKEHVCKQSWLRFVKDDEMISIERRRKKKEGIMIYEGEEV